MFRENCLNVSLKGQLAPNASGSKLARRGAMRRSLSTPGTASGFPMDQQLIDDRVKYKPPDRINYKHTRHLSSEIGRLNGSPDESPCNNYSNNNWLSLSFSNRFNFFSSTNNEIITSPVLRYLPEDIAAQLTLLDLPLFQMIKESELRSCAWNTSKKTIVTPNIVAFTRRFNQVTFWVVKEVLSSSEAKHRAEIISHFIKVARRLFEDFNNLNSCFATISALNSTPIYRLSKTWAYVSKKSKSSFDKLVTLFSDNNNFECLRVHVSQSKLPLIPYLGMYLRDIIYIDIAHPSSPGHLNSLRETRLNSILSKITECQRSSYDIPRAEHLERYLNSVNYIEELQKFLEDDNYKLSLKLEPLESKSPPLPTSDKKGHQRSLSTFYVKDNEQFF